MKLDAFDFAALAERHDTPFYLYDLDQAIAHLELLRADFPPNLHVMYCAKANASPAVLRAFADKTPFLDISSAGELSIALAHGYLPENISFAGPGKTERELERAVRAGVGTISVESAAELSRLCSVCRTHDQRAAITVRINPEHVAKGFGMSMAGRPSQFGVPREDASDVLKAALAAPEIELRGIHVFAGTQCLDENALIANIEQTLAIAHELCEQHQLAPQTINLGGGLGVAYFEGQRALDTARVSKRIAQSVRNFCAANPSYGPTRFVLELGRFLMAEFGVYVCRVVEVKQTRGKRFAILDGGMHHCFAATGNFGQLIKKNYPVFNLSAPSAASAEHALERFELVGPLCTPLDSMARNLALPRAEPGDLIGFASCGAYSFSASPLMFLAHDTPPELAIVAGEVVLSRPRRQAIDLL
jgi:diaminopimelate decarboxylase